MFIYGSCTEKVNPEKPEPTKDEEPPVEVVPGPELVLVSPEDGSSFVVEHNNTYTFEWELFEDQTFYRLHLSRSSDMSTKETIAVKNGKAELNSVEFNAALVKLGFGSQETADLYWSIGPWAENTDYTPQVRKLTVTSLPAERASIPVTDPIKVKVAVVIEDPVYTNPADQFDPRTGKRIHEIEKWNDPLKQLEEYAAVFEEMSHGAVDIEIVEIHDSNKMFCYTSSTKNGTREYMTPAVLYQRYLDPDPVTGKKHKDIDGSTLEYDYVAMMDEFGLSSKVDKGIINEVWVYNHPACKMNESRFMGEGGFWCNSMPIEYGTGKNRAHNRKLVCVMFCNYERTVDLAIHSFGHRTESIMSQLYYQNYDTSRKNWRDYSKYGVFTYVYDRAWFTGTVKDLNNFDLFFSHGKAFDKVNLSGYAHIGTCHSPCNTMVDYGYDEKSTIMTFADEWNNYPNIYSNPENARKVTSSEWKDPKGAQYGYMKWFFGHVPHFQGLNEAENDLHLNNWWHYLFDFYGALEVEASLRANIGK